jgi:hypothetical protein
MTIGLIPMSEHTVAIGNCRILSSAISSGESVTLSSRTPWVAKNGVPALSSDCRSRHWLLSRGMFSGSMESPTFAGEITHGTAPQLSMRIWV